MSFAQLTAYLCFPRSIVDVKLALMHRTRRATSRCAALRVVSNLLPALKSDSAKSHLLCTLPHSICWQRFPLQTSLNVHQPRVYNLANNYGTEDTHMESCSDSNASLKINNIDSTDKKCHSLLSDISGCSESAAVQLFISSRGFLTCIVDCLRNVTQRRSVVESKEKSHETQNLFFKSHFTAISQTQSYELLLSDSKSTTDAKDMEKRRSPRNLAPLNRSPSLPIDDFHTKRPLSALPFRQPLAPQSVSDLNTFETEYPNDLDLIVMPAHLYARNRLREHGINESGTELVDTQGHESLNISPTERLVATLVGCLTLPYHAFDSETLMKLDIISLMSWWTLQLGPGGFWNEHKRTIDVSARFSLPSTRNSRVSFKRQVNGEKHVSSVLQSSSTLFERTRATEEISKVFEDDTKEETGELKESKEQDAHLGEYPRQKASRSYGLSHSCPIKRVFRKIDLEYMAWRAFHILALQLCCLHNLSSFRSLNSIIIEKGAPIAPISTSPVISDSERFHSQTPTPTHGRSISSLKSVSGIAKRIDAPIVVERARRDSIPSTQVQQNLSVLSASPQMHAEMARSGTHAIINSLLASIERLKESLSQCSNLYVSLQSILYRGDLILDGAFGLLDGDSQLGDSSFNGWGIRAMRESYHCDDFAMSFWVKPEHSSMKTCRVLCFRGMLNPQIDKNVDSTSENALNVIDGSNLGNDDANSATSQNVARKDTHASVPITTNDYICESLLAEAYPLLILDMNNRLEWTIGVDCSVPTLYNASSIKSIIGDAFIFGRGPKKFIKVRSSVELNVQSWSHVLCQCVQDSGLQEMHLCILVNGMPVVDVRIFPNAIEAPKQSLTPKIRIRKCGKSLWIGNLPKEEKQIMQVQSFRGYLADFIWFSGAHLSKSDMLCLFQAGRLSQFHDSWKLLNAHAQRIILVAHQMSLFPSSRKLMCNHTWISVLLEVLCCLIPVVKLDVLRLLKVLLPYCHPEILEPLPSSVISHIITYHGQKQCKRGNKCNIDHSTKKKSNKDGESSSGRPGSSQIPYDSNPIAALIVYFSSFIIHSISMTNSINQRTHNTRDTTSINQENCRADHEIQCPQIEVETFHQEEELFEWSFALETQVVLMVRQLMSSNITAWKSAILQIFQDTLGSNPVYHVSTGHGHANLSTMYCCSITTLAIYTLRGFIPTFTRGSLVESPESGYTTGIVLDVANGLVKLLKPLRMQSPYLSETLFSLASARMMPISRPTSSISTSHATEKKEGDTRNKKGSIDSTSPPPWKSYLSALQMPCFSPFSPIVRISSHLSNESQPSLICWMPRHLVRLSECSTPPILLSEPHCVVPIHGHSASTNAQLLLQQIFLRSCQQVGSIITKTLQTGNDLLTPISKEVSTATHWCTRLLKGINHDLFFARNTAVYSSKKSVVDNLDSEVCSSASISAPIDTPLVQVEKELMNCEYSQSSPDSTRRQVGSIIDSPNLIDLFPVLLCTACDELSLSVNPWSAIAKRIAKFSLIGTIDEDANGTKSDNDANKKEDGINVLNGSSIADIERVSTILWQYVQRWRVSSYRQEKRITVISGLAKIESLFPTSYCASQDPRGVTRGARGLATDGVTQTFKFDCPDWLFSPQDIGMKPFDSRYISEIESANVAYPAIISKSYNAGGVRIKGLSNFPTLRVANVELRHGKWYYEVQLITDGLMQIGWVDSIFSCDDDDGQGVGDDSHSWAFDGCRFKKWNGSSGSYGAAWHSGDVIGCFLDLDNCVMRFTLNGFDLGVAFSAFSYTGGLCPAISLNQGESINLNVGGFPFQFPPICYADAQVTEFSAVIVASQPCKNDSGSALSVGEILANRNIALQHPSNASVSYKASTPEYRLGDYNTYQEIIPEFNSNFVQNSTHDTKEVDYHDLEDREADVMLQESELQDDMKYEELAQNEEFDEEIEVVDDDEEEDEEEEEEDLEVDDDENENEDEERGEISNELQRQSFIMNLLNMGFDMGWCLRAVEEEAVGLDENRAVSWIINQMERESSMRVLGNDIRFEERQDDGRASLFSSGEARDQEAEFRVVDVSEFTHAIHNDEPSHSRFDSVYQAISNSAVNIDMSMALSFAHNSLGELFGHDDEVAMFAFQEGYTSHLNMNERFDGGATRATMVPLQTSFERLVSRSPLMIQFHQQIGHIDSIPHVSDSNVREFGVEDDEAEDEELREFDEEVFFGLRSDRVADSTIQAISYIDSDPITNTTRASDSDGAPSFFKKDNADNARQDTISSAIMAVLTMPKPQKNKVSSAGKSSSDVMQDTQEIEDAQNLLSHIADRIPQIAIEFDSILLILYSRRISLTVLCHLYVGASPQEVLRSCGDRCTECDIGLDIYGFPKDASLSYGVPQAVASPPLRTREDVSRVVNLVKLLFDRGETVGLANQQIKCILCHILNAIFRIGRTAQYFLRHLESDIESCVESRAASLKVNKESLRSIFFSDSISRNSQHTDTIESLENCVNEQFLPFMDHQKASIHLFISERLQTLLLEKSLMCLRRVQISTNKNEVLFFLSFIFLLLHQKKKIGCHGTNVNLCIIYRILLKKFLPTSFFDRYYCKFAKKI